MLPTETQSTVSLAESDSEINEDVFFIPERSPVVARTVRISTDETLQPQTVVHDGDENNDDDGDGDENNDGDDNGDEHNDGDGDGNENTIFIGNSNEILQQQQQQQPTGPNAHIMVTFQSENYDGVTSEQISRIISHTHGDVFIPHHPHGQVTELKLESPPEPIHQQLNTQPQQSPTIRRSQRRPRQNHPSVEITGIHNTQPHQRRRQS